MVFQTKSYAFVVSALPKSISDKRAAKKRKSLNKIVFLDVGTTVRHTFPSSELQCLPCGDSRNRKRKHKDPTTGNSFIHRNIKIARDYRAVKLGCSDGCGLHHSTQPEACFSGDPRASCVGPQHDRGRSDTVMISMNFDSCATLAIFCIIPVLSCFVFELELYILYEC